MDPQQPPLQPYVPPGMPPAGAAQPLPPGNGMPPAAPPTYTPVAPVNIGAQPYTPGDAASPAITPSPLGQSPLSPIAPQPVPGAGPPPQNASALKQEVIERLRQANNVLVTVSNNPSVDQLSAAIGMTLVLNKLDKHATAVFSGEVPNAISFLAPEKTLEKNTDSLRDFIIALDKSKADKLRYKVEDKFVKIFITPYHTSLSQEDLEFSQGDFNVDVVIALGVHKREELDEAIIAHGRILHDAAVVSVNNVETADLGGLNWFEPDASSLSEMLVSLIEPLQGQQTLLDSQIATAFLTGLVAETDRFSNNKTSPHTMNTSAMLMRAGANQQLVATKLEEAETKEQKDSFDKNKLDELAKEHPANPAAPAAAVASVKAKDGALQIEHQKQAANAPPSKSLADLESEIAEEDNNGEEGDDTLDKIHIDDQGTLRRIEEMKEDEAKQQKAEAEKASQPPVPSEMILQPPSLGGDLSANTKPEALSPAVDPLVVSPPAPGQAQVPDIGNLQHGKSLNPISDTDTTPQTLSQIEDAVDSPHTDGRDDAQREMEAKARNDANVESEITRSSQAGRDEDVGATPVELNLPAAAPEESRISEDRFPDTLVHPDTGLPPDPTASSTSSPTPPPDLPPPLRMPPA